MMHDRATADSLGLLRIVVFGLWAVLVWAAPLAPLAGLPRRSYKPVGFLALAPSGVWDVVLDERFLGALRIVLVLLALLVALGVTQRRMLAIGVAVLLVFQQGILRGYSGHLNHAELPLLYVTGILAALPISDGLSFRPADAETRQSRAWMYRFGFLLPAAVLVTTYGFAAVARLANGGLAIYSDGSMHSWVLDHWLAEVVSVNPLPDLPFVLESVPAWGWGVLFAVGTVLELATPLVLISRPVRLVVPLALLGFHAATDEWMGVSFHANMVLIVALLMPGLFHPVARRLTRDRASESPPPAELRQVASTPNVTDPAGPPPR